MNTQPVNISIVSPIYGCGTCLSELYSKLLQTLSSLDLSFEIIFVNDASPDKSWEIIEKLSQSDKRIKGINLSRNFGQHHAITAGLDFAKGEWIVVMDCDLQDKPEEIVKLYNKAVCGYDYVQARRIKRKDRFFKRITSKIFYLILQKLTDTTIDNSIANFGIYSKKVIDSVKILKEKIRWFPTLINWVGYNGTTIDVIHSQRHEGKSSYSFRKLLRLAIDVIILNSDKPLRLFVKFGFIISILSFLYAVYVLIRYIGGHITVLGWPSLIISIWFLFGITISILGIVGLYIAKIFEHSKNRPLYLIKEKTF